MCGWVGAKFSGLVVLRMRPGGLSCHHPAWLSDPEPSSSATGATREDRLAAVQQEREQARTQGNERTGYDNSR
jgi:hypothetical protein